MVGMGKTGIAGLALAGLIFVVTALACSSNDAPTPSGPSSPPPTTSADPSGPGSLGKDPDPPPPLPLACGAAACMTPATPAASALLPDPDLVVDGFGDRRVFGHLESTGVPFVALLAVFAPALVKAGPAASGFRVRAELGTRYFVCPEAAGKPCEVWTQTLEPDPTAATPPFPVSRGVGENCVAGRGVACLEGPEWSIELDPAKTPADVRSYQRPRLGGRGFVVFEDGTAAWVEGDHRLTFVPIPDGVRLFGARAFVERDKAAREYLRFAGITTDGELLIGDERKVLRCAGIGGFAGFGTLGIPMAWRPDGTSAILGTAGNVACGPSFATAPTRAQAVPNCSCNGQNPLVAGAIGNKGVGTDRWQCSICGE